MNAMQASPWGNTDLNKKLMSYVTENVSAASEFTQQLSRAQSVEDAIKIQTEFVKTQTDAFGQRAKEVGTRKLFAISVRRWAEHSRDCSFVLVPSGLDSSERQ
jgi:hypothetical protein